MLHKIKMVITLKIVT